MNAISDIASAATAQPTTQSTFGEDAEQLTRFKTSTRDMDAIVHTQLQNLTSPEEKAEYLDALFQKEREGGFQEGTTAGIVGRLWTDSIPARDSLREGLGQLNETGRLDAEQLVNANPGHQRGMDRTINESPYQVQQTLSEIVSEVGDMHLNADYGRALISATKDAGSEIQHGSPDAALKRQDTYAAAIATAKNGLAAGDDAIALDLLQTLWADPTLRQEVVAKAPDGNDLADLLNHDYGSPRADDFTETLWQEMVEQRPQDSGVQQKLKNYYQNNAERLAAEATDPGYGAGKLYPDGSPIPVGDIETARANEVNDDALISGYVSNILLNDGLDEEAVGDGFKGLEQQAQALLSKANDRSLPFVERQQSARELHGVLNGIAKGIEGAVERAKEEGDLEGIKGKLDDISTVVGLLPGLGGTISAGISIFSNNLESADPSTDLMDAFVKNAITDLNEPSGANYEQDAKIRDIVQNGRL